MRVLVATLGVVLLVTPVGVSALLRSAQTSPQPIYAGFTLLKTGKLSTRRCGAYVVTTGTYTGRSSTPDPRLAGVVTFVARIAQGRESAYGIATGTMTVRDARSRVRMRATVTGVLIKTSISTINGLVSGTLIDPAGRLLANVTMVFDDELGFGVVRLGMESGANSGVAYPPVPKC